MRDKDKVVWVTDVANVFELASVKQETNQTQTKLENRISIQLLETKATKQVPLSQVYEYDESHLKSCANLAHLNKLNEPAVLQTIHSRYQNDLIYTYIQPLLISVNPFKLIDHLYDISHYASQADDHRLSHIYHCAELCLRSACHINHAILVSGESGAGKTQSCKKLLNYFVNYSAHAHGDDHRTKVNIEDQLVACNSILESFGNAQTIHNHNSSRYGKYLRLWLQV